MKDEIIYYKNIKFEVKSFRVEDVDYVLLKPGGYGMFTMKIYSAGKKVLTLDSTYVGFNLLLKYLEDNEIAFSDKKIK